MLGRRTFTTGAIAGLLGPAAALRAEDFPTRQITLVAPFPAGSVTDAVARALAQHLHDAFGQPVVVDNRAGAQGTLGAALVAQAKPDGHTLLVGSSVIFTARSLFKRLSFDPVASFQPVAGVASTSMLFMVADSSPIRSIADLAAAARREQPPVTIGFGSPSAQVAIALFASVSQTNPVPVSYRGTPQVLADLAAGHIQVGVVDIGNGIAQISNTKMRPVAISAAGRYAALPDVQTLVEVFPGATGTLETIIAVMAPAGTPAPVVARLDTAIRAALATPELKARLAFLHLSPLPLPSDQVAERIRTDNPRWDALIRKAGIEQE